MGFWSDIRDKIFPPAQAQEAPAQPAPAPKPTAAPAQAPAPAPKAAPTQAAPQPSVPQPSPVAPSSPQPIDVTDVLDKAVAAKGQKLDWRHSIVDLMKAIDVDSSLQARQALAKELDYTGDANDSATMNVWLHKAVIKKLSENGGKVPADLLD